MPEAYQIGTSYTSGKAVSLVPRGWQETNPLSSSPRR